MKSIVLPGTLLLTMFVVVAARGQESATGTLAQDGALPRALASDYKFTEGPAVDPDGNVFFTDQPNDRIMKWSAADGTLTEFMTGAGRANGLFFDAMGNLLACADQHNELWKIDRDRNVTVLVNNFEGKKLNGPNDLWVDQRGGIYFTDPFYKREYWDRTEKQIEEENVYYLSPEKKLSVAATGFVRPNGIVGSPDGKILYVADISGRKTYSFRIESDGALTGRSLFTEMGSDGMTVDTKGNVYLTGKGVTVFNRNGEKIDHIPVPEPWTANVCFGGKDRDVLFITASTSVYAVKMKTRGVRR